MGKRRLLNEVNMIELLAVIITASKAISMGHGSTVQYYNKVLLDIF
jgi:hypothetical protein